MARTHYESVDAYIAAQPKPTRSALERVRATLSKALPGATEEISYQIPAYKQGGVMVLYFAGYPRHYAIYPATPRLVGALKKELAGLLHGKATLRFSLTDAVPTRLITRIAKLRAAEAIERAEAKKTKHRASSKPKRNASKKRPKTTSA